MMWKTLPSRRVTLRRKTGRTMTEEEEEEEENWSLCSFNVELE